MHQVNRGGARNIQDRTFDFAIRIVRLCHYLEKQSDTSRTLARQLLRSGTSIGANVEEAQAGQSKADFVSKYAIALKEARETRFWLRILIAAGMVPAEQIAELLKECEEISAVVGAIIVSAKKGLDEGKRRK